MVDKRHGEGRDGWQSGSHRGQFGQIVEHHLTREDEGGVRSDPHAFVLLHVVHRAVLFWHAVLTQVLPQGA